MYVLNTYALNTYALNKPNFKKKEETVIVLIRRIIPESKTQPISWLRP